MEKELKRLREIERELSLLYGAIGLLYWDEHTYIPKKAVPQRGEQIAYLSKLYHEKSTSKELKGIINRLSSKTVFNKLSKIDQHAIKKHKKQITRFSKLPSSFIEEQMKLLSESHAAWLKAREAKDFSILEPYLEKVIAMTKKKANLIDPKEHPYNVLLDDYEEGMTVKELNLVFAELKPRLIGIINKIRASEKFKKQENKLSKMNFPADKQMKIVNDLKKLMLLEDDRTNVAQTVHPFEVSISPDDVRITTACRPGKPFFSLGSTVHEAGHALYELGLPRELKYTILFNASSTGMHESQSRFWELFVSRSREFWDFYYNKYQKEFDELKNVSKEEFYELLNQVNFSPIRIECDEVTYNMHIIIRYELELALIEGKLKVRDLSKAWNAKYKEYLGITPKDDVEGVMQDTHWPDGNFGYFPTYSLGTMYAAMLSNQMKKEMPLQKYIKEGNFRPILDWLRKNIHNKGATMFTKDIIKQICKRDLVSDDFINYLKEKYGKIYKL